MKKKILFRADGSSSMGLGHLFRLLALVEMFKEDYEYIYLTNASTTTEVIPSKYKTRIIPELISFSEEPIWLSKNYPASEHLIIADGYQFDSQYQKEIKKLGYTLVYIDDLATEHMYADLVVNHSPNIKEKDFKSELYTSFALGIDYAILRPGFIKEAKVQKKIEYIKNVFVCFGGSDYHDLTNKCIQGIIDLKEINIIHIVIGGAYKHTEIFKTIKNKENRVLIHQNLSEEKMLDVMRGCQLAIVPSSTICYEVCSSKMIIISGFYVDNQINIYNGMNKKEMIYGVGDFNQLSSNDFKNKTLHVLNDSYEEYEKKLNIQKTLFDGLVKERFLSLINKLN
tara:strand:+ start:236855 stop:237874 length:1020 start_codon:yes stop_codon:yes gene_type:complete